VLALARGWRALVSLLHPFLVFWNRHSP
jgi:hypothetical protein